MSQEDHKRRRDRAKEKTHFFQPVTLRIGSWKHWKQLNCRASPRGLNSRRVGGKNQVSQSGKSVERGGRRREESRSVRIRALKQPAAPLWRFPHY